MSADDRKVHRNIVSGREIFVCDNSIAPAVLLAVEASVKVLHFSQCLTTASASLNPLAMRAAPGRSRCRR